MVRIINNLKEHLRTFRGLTRTRLHVEGLELTPETVSRMSDTIARLSIESEDFERRIADNTREIETYQAMIADYRNEIARLQSIVDLQRKSYLNVTRQLAMLPADASKARQEDQSDDPFLDVFYRELEDEYRGTKEEISQRLQFYLPHLYFLQDRKKPKAVDIGCGRGEWLQIMSDEGIPVVGVDNNASQAGDIDIEGKDIEIVIADALDWLREQKDGSVDLVTAFHVIEHIPFNALVALLKEVLRVLKPGGKVILETPNPESLIVGAYKFWFDPTHIRPLPPELMGRLMESLSFSSVQIVRLHPDGRSLDFRDRDGLPQELSDLIAGPLDYAIICERR